MDHGKLSRSSRLALLVVVVMAVALVLAAAAVAATPTITIIGPQYYMMGPSPSASPTAAAPAVHDSWVDLFFQDNGWNADSYRLSNDGGTTWSSPYPFPSPTPYAYWQLYDGLYDPSLTLDGPHTVTAQFSNDLGVTWGASASATTLVDEQSPEVTAPDGYWNNNYQYLLSSHDQVGLAGVQDLWWRVDGGPLNKVSNSQPLGTSTPLTASFDLAGETGTAHTVYYNAMDYAGNYNYMLYATRLLKATLGRTPYGIGFSSYVVIDRTAPTIKARGVGKAWHYAPVAVRFTASDADAGVDLIQYSITGKKATKPGAWTDGNSVIVTSYGKHKVWYQAVDAAQPVGNTSAPAWVMVKIHR
jgi:hypothetical protein